MARRKVAAIATALGLLALPASSDRAGAAPPMFWGAYAEVRGAETSRMAVEYLDRLVGRKLAAIRVFSTWDQSFPDRFESWAADSGRVLVLSIKPRRADGTPILWKDIAAARPGSALWADMVRIASQLQGIGRPVYVILHHEPEAALNLGFGTAAEFVGAWQTFVRAARSVPSSNLKFLWVLTDDAFSTGPGDRRFPGNWYPGDGSVDAIGADVYNWYDCRGGQPTPWRSFAEIVEPLRRFGASHSSKELWIPELGSVEDAADPSRKASWLRDVTTTLSSPGYEQFRGILYFHDEHDPSQFPRCDWWIDSSAQSVAAFAEMGRATRFGAVLDAAPPPGNGQGNLPSVSTPALAGQPAVRLEDA